MNTPHSSFSAPRKELVSSIQKSLVLFIMLVLVLVFGMYKLMDLNLEHQSKQQDKLSELLYLVQNAEEHWLEWMLVNDGGSEGGTSFSNNQTLSDSDHFRQMLLSEYELIDFHLVDFKEVSSIDVSDALGLLKKEVKIGPFSAQDQDIIYRSFDQLEILDTKLLEVGVRLDYERKLFLERLIWAPIAALVIIVLVAVILSMLFTRRLRTGFSHLHHILDHHKHGHSSIEPQRKVVDEFTDIGHLVDNELSSRGYDIEHRNIRISLIEKALSKVDQPLLVVNNEGDIIWFSAGFEHLWNENASVFESIFGIDAGLDSPMGERVADAVLQSDELLTLGLVDGFYSMGIRGFDGGQSSDQNNLQCLIAINLKSEAAELEVLRKSLALMEQDVWNIPIRVLREDSPYISFAMTLEALRGKVVALFDALNDVKGQTNSSEKITKLQQIASIIDEEINDNNQVVNEVVPVLDVLPNDVQSELNEVAILSQTVRDSLIVGYESVLQRLALVEKDLSSDVFLLDDVDRCLNEVRAGALSSLAATEGESENVRRRFSIDLNHDIDSVQSQIESMKKAASSTLSLLESDRSVGVARLDRARESVDEMIERISELMEKTSNILDSDGEGAEIESLQQSSDEWDEF
ncbi:hypothetical protein [Marinomonas transparens]|uniref:Uncharacterized protein n=1 Tax=Marinomonas transparens TaxID=2795388 RepID=A0A934N592_9GAMM|nr:hypothetical protein [Marinomonas transparens]MBJ7536801.1 hypothetical protein [Marinomonas transparens]